VVPGIPVDDIFGEISSLHFIDSQNFSILFLILAAQINFADPDSYPKNPAT
jgi:hypothetical protein